MTAQQVRLDETPIDADQRARFAIDGEPPRASLRWMVFGLYCAIVAAVSVQRLMLGPDAYNNFSIFRWSYFNLLHGDLFAVHPDQYKDLFKYSPTFAVLMAGFFHMPVALGLIVWTALNAFVPYWGVRALAISERSQTFILLFVVSELLVATQNVQSNALVAGLIICTFIAFEREQPALAALLVCLGFFVKVFPAVAALMCVMYAQKRRFVIAAMISGAIMAVLPALVIGVDGLLAQYGAWLQLLGSDPAGERNYSIMTLAQRVLHVTAPDAWFLVPGVAVLVLPLLQRERWSQFNFRLSYLACILVWVVIFNHKAESPTYIIAMFGVAIWGVTQAPSPRRTALLIFAFVLTGLSASTLFPAFLRANVIRPYALKALPCVVVWFAMMAHLLAGMKAISTVPSRRQVAGQS